MLPTTEDLNRRVCLREWSDLPNVLGGADQAFSAGTYRWAKVEPIYGLAMREGMQTGEVPTHLFWIRYGNGTRPEDITSGHVIEWNNRRYRVLNAINVNDAQRFTRIACKELGIIS